MPPKRFDIYEDCEGNHFLLIDERPTGFWLSFKLQTATLTFLSPLKLIHLQRIGHAELK